MRHTDALVATGKKDRHGNDITKPEAVIYYSGTKQGIDVSDQMASCHCALRKTICLYHKVVISAAAWYSRCKCNAFV